jgi:hypothetical protein
MTVFLVLVDIPPEVSGVESIGTAEDVGISVVETRVEERTAPLGSVVTTTVV